MLNTHSIRYNYVYAIKSNQLKNMDCSMIYRVWHKLKCMHKLDQLNIPICDAILSSKLKQCAEIDGLDYTEGRQIFVKSSKLSVDV